MVRPLCLPCSIKSISASSPVSDVSDVILSSQGIFHSFAILSQAFWRNGMGQFCESIPMRVTPRRMNGNTVRGNSWEATLPQQVMQPPGAVDLIDVARISPPRRDVSHGGE